MRIAHSIILIIIVANISLFFCSCSYFSPSELTISELTTSSPDKTYKVYMTEKEESVADYLANFSIEKQGKDFIQDEIFYHDSGRFLYSDLRPNWLSESILTFGALNDSVKGDEISAVNQTNKIIRYLKVNANDRFLILESKPNTKMQLFDYPQTDKTADISWIGGIGLFDRRAENSGMGNELSHTRKIHFTGGLLCVY